MLWFLREKDIWRLAWLRESLSWYYGVLKEDYPPLYKLARYLKLSYIDIRDVNLSDLERLSEAQLWELHDRLGSIFQDIIRESRQAHSELQDKFRDRDGNSPSLLDIKIELVRRLAYSNEHCRLCERRCNLTAKFCKVKVSHVSSYFLHLGEEEPLIPSGTIFFSGCNLKCVYCQNWDISVSAEAGIKVTADRLAKMMEELSDASARNINFVGGDPIPHLPVILEALRLTDVNTPMLFNSNLYMTGEALKLIVDIFDIFLPDFKYGNSDCAKRLSLVDNYFEVVSRNMKLLADMKKDTIIRHLVLPGHIECCSNVVFKWIRDNFPRAVVNVMAQYHPDHLVARFPGKWPELSSPLSSAEYRRALELAENYNLQVLR